MNSGSLSGTFLIVAARLLSNLSFTSVVDDSVGAYALMRVTVPLMSGAAETGFFHSP